MQNGYIVCVKNRRWNDETQTWEDGQDKFVTNPIRAFENIVLDPDKINAYTFGFAGAANKFVSDVFPPAAIEQNLVKVLRVMA